MANEYLYFATGDNNYAWQIDGVGEYTSLMGFGWDHDSGDHKMNGAVRVSSLPINKDAYIYSADLTLDDIYRTGESIWFATYGIDEDNTSDFGNPFGRSRTSAVNNQYEYDPNDRMGIGVTGQVREITSRSGWSNGNAIGFLVIADDLCNHGAKNNYILCDDIWLKIKYAQEPDFTPTTITVAAPTFPSADNYGIKISKPGASVHTATRSDLLFTTREDVTKMKAEGQVSTTAGVTYNIAHGLAYKPQCLCYVRKNGYSFELPRLLGGASDPVGGGVQGYFSVDSTNLKIVTFQNADVYYYILLDEQPT